MATKEELAALEARHKAIQSEMYSIVTKTNVTPAQRAIDDARIKVLNKQAAEVVAQQNAIRISTSNAPVINTSTEKPASSSPAAIDKNNALQAKRTDLQAQLDVLKAKTDPTDADKRQIRAINNQISDIEYQYRTDKDLIGLAGQNMSAGDKMFVFGAASGTVGGAGTIVAPKLMEVAGAVKSTEVALGADKPKQESDESPTPKKLTKELKFGVLPNVLHQYATYTYGISLHMLTDKEYNQVVQDEKYIPKRVLVASAGKYNDLIDQENSFVRAKHFSRDYYFDELNITTLIGLNEYSRMTNAIDINFTIVEPYGITFLENLLKLCSEPDIATGNYLDMPYLLEIDFYANTDSGEIVNKIPGLTKRIPILLTRMEVKASIKGAEYKITATPYNHSAFNTTTNQVPVGMTIVAGTVNEFFHSIEGDGIPSTTTPDRETPLTVQEIVLGVGKNKNVKSFGGALNDWYAEFKKYNKLETNDRFFFQFDPEIGNSHFGSIDTNTTDPKDTRMADVDNTISVRLASATQQGSGDFDSTLREFKFNAGTTIEKVINTIVRMSSYVQKQIILPEDYKKSADYQRALEEAKSAPLNWFKIVPEIHLGKFDPIKRQYQRDIIYHVQKYVIKNVKLDIAPQQVADDPLKVYNYWYLGTNDDIIDFDIQFNALYYNAVTAFKERMTHVYNVPAKSEEYRYGNPDGYLGTPQDPNAVMPLIMKPVVTNTRIQGPGTEVTARGVATGDLEESLLSSSIADMVGVKLKILGDPQFIKQDDVFYKPKHKTDDTQLTSDPRITPNGSIRTDNGEVYVQLSFRTPIDYDESTGEMEYDPKFKISVFSGLYRVIKVDSRFAQGMFTQVLELSRLFRQSTYDSVGPTVKKDTNRVEDATAAVNAVQNNNVADVAGAGSTGATKTTDSEPNDAQRSAQDQQTTTNATNETPAVTDEQKKLMETNKTAETTPITDRNEPQATIPPRLRAFNPFGNIPAGGDANQATQNAQNILGGG